MPGPRCGPREPGGATRAVVRLLVALATLGATVPAGAAGDAVFLAATNGGSPFIGDRSDVTTVSPNGDGYRDAAVLCYRLPADAAVRFEVLGRNRPTRLLRTPLRRGAGEQRLVWRPPAYPASAAYVVRMSVTRPGRAATARRVVVHVQGVDAAAGQASYRPGDTVRVAVATDASHLTVDVLRIDDTAPTTRRNDVVEGTRVSHPFQLRWAGRDLRPHNVGVLVGEWPSGVYFVRLRADDGRVGYAPFLVRPRRLGSHRIAVVMPTDTWQAYNFRDRDGDGRGDTWYAGWRSRTTRLGRPFLDRGVPPRFRPYDLPFLRWAARRGLQADYLSDGDLASVEGGDRLARLYDLVVFPGHHEYVTRKAYTTVRRYRDLGGNLAWLSANNFFWQVARRGPILERVVQWRHAGLPEAALVGVQYLANDRGARRAPMIVGDPSAAPWLLAGTGLRRGDAWGRFGIEIDSRTASSPPGTRVIASVADLYGPGYTAEMTYYETAAGAKVFAAGAFTLAGQAMSAVGSRMLDNLFDHMTEP